MGNGPLPEDYQTAYLCDVLKLSHDELMGQPAEWVKEMLEYYEQKAKVEEYKTKQMQKHQGQKRFT